MRWLLVFLVSALLIEPEHDPATRAADMASMVSVEQSYNVPLEEEYVEYVVSVCEEYGLDPAVVFAVMWQESRYLPDVIGDQGTSFGIMQIKPRWHSERMARLGVTDLLDEWQAVLVGCDYLAELLKVDGTYRTALTLYRYGDLNVTGEDYAGIVLAQAREIGGEN